MKIAFQSSRYDELQLIDELKYTVLHKLKYFDIFFDGFMPEDITDTEKKFIKKLIKSNFRFSIHFPIAEYKTINENTQKVIDFANTINPTHMTIHFDKLSYECLYAICDKLNKNIKLCIENTIPDINTLYQTNYIEFMKNTDRSKNIFSTFDTGHCHVNQYKFDEYIHLIVNNSSGIETIHIHDNNGNEDSHQPVGNGTIDFKMIKEQLISHNQTPLFVIEHWTDNKQSLDKIKKIFGSLAT